MNRRVALCRAIAPAALTTMLALGGCGDTDGASSDSTAAPTTTEPTTTAAPTTTEPTTTAPPTSSSAAPTTEAPATTSTAPPTTQDSGPTTTTHDGPVIQLAVGDEVSRHTVSAGDNVLLVVTGDAIDEVHVHGYDLLAELRPGQAAQITFVADIPGVFEIELEGAHQLLAELEVR